MKPKIVLRSLGALLLVILMWVTFQAGTSYAQSGEQVVPKSYGPLKAAVGQSLVFEDANGTIRIVVVKDLTIVRR